MRLQRLSAIAPLPPRGCVMLALACVAWLAGATPAWPQGSTPPAATEVAVATATGDFDQDYLAARELARSGRREQALAAYTALLQRSPGNSEVLLGRGRLYAWMKRWAESEADLLAVTARSPAYADAWSALGDLYLWTDRPRRAVEAYGRWLALAAEDDPAPLLARARAWRDAGDTAAARADFSAAGARGADPAQIDKYLATLSPRALHPGPLSPEAIALAGERWSASLGAGWIGFSGSRSDWADASATVRRHFERGSLALEILTIDRFGLGDNALALDGYVDLWDRAYANLRFQHGPQGELFPDSAAWAELFQAAGQGWELSAGMAHLDFRRTKVNIYSMGVGKYVGSWYLRLRHIHVPDDVDTSNSERLLVRYYYKGDGDNYVELAAGYGRSDQPLPNNPGASNTWSARAAFVRFPSRRWGYKLGAGVGREDGGYDERTVFGSLYTRW